METKSKNGMGERKTNKQKKKTSATNIICIQFWRVCQKDLMVL